MMEPTLRLELPPPPPALKELPREIDEIADRRAALMAQRNAIMSAGDPFHPNALVLSDIDRAELRRSLRDANAGIAEADKAESAARVALANARASYRQAVLQRLLPSRTAAVREIEHHWRAMLASWQELDEIDAALRQNHASLRPHVNAAQIEALGRKFVGDATD